MMNDLTPEYVFNSYCDIKQKGGHDIAECARLYIQHGKTFPNKHLSLTLDQNAALVNLLVDLNNDQYVRFYQMVLSLGLNHTAFIQAVNVRGAVRFLSIMNSPETKDRAAAVAFNNFLGNRSDFIDVPGFNEPV